MSLKLRNPLAMVLMIAFAWLAAPGQRLFADEHAVTAADLHQAIMESAKTRQTNVETVQKFFKSEVVQKTLGHQIVDATKVEKAIPLLNDEELSRLASQCNQVERDISAGELNNQEMTYILIALATAVIILVLVAA
jgi:Flp pilus assembly protein TadB